MSIDIIKHNGKIDAVYSYDCGQTIIGFEWRFLLDAERVLVVLPYQTKHNPAVSNHRIPSTIEPILLGLQGMGDLGLIVKYIQTANRQDFAVSCTLSAAGRQKFAEWYKKQDFKALEEWEKAEARIHSELESRWKKEGPELQPTPEQIKEWKESGKNIDQEANTFTDARIKERDEIMNNALASLYSDRARCAEVKRQKVKIDKKKSQLIEKQNGLLRDQYQIETLMRLNEFIGAYTGKCPVKLPPLPKGKSCYSVTQSKKIAAALKNKRTKGGQLLHTIYCHIETVCSTLETNADYNQLLEFIADQTSTKCNILRQYLIEAYSPAMPGHINQWVEETVQAEGMSEEEARQHLFDNVNYVADFGDGIKYLIKNLFMRIHTYRDSLCWERMKPPDEVREEIEKYTSLQKEVTTAADMNILSLDINAPQWVSANNEDRKFPENHPNIVKSGEYARIMGFAPNSSAHIQSKEDRKDTGLQFWLRDNKGNKLSKDAGYYVTDRELKHSSKC